MAQTPYAAANGLTRPHWGGADSDVDIHLEVYKDEVDSQFEYNAIFRGLSSQRSVRDRSNTYRIDRLGTSQVKGRRSGEALDPTPVRNDKLLIVVDTVLYIRNPIDYQDDWTAPDFLAEMGRNNGTQFAHEFDQAHIIQLIKGRDFVAPEHLKPAFSDGIEIQATVDSSATTQAALEANAVQINLAHKASVDELIKRQVPLRDMVTILDTSLYSMLLEHPKLFNVDFGTQNSNGYADRRAVRMNGIPVIESTEFPQAPGTHPLGAAYTTTADDVKCKMITFSKSMTLVTVEAQPFTSRIWDDKENFANVLDCYAMYQVGQRRPDTSAVVSFTDAAGA